MTVLGIIFTIIAFIVAAAILVGGYYAYVTWKTAKRVEAMVPPPGKFITVDGNRIHYVDRGTGRHILFIHGLGGTQFHMAHTLFSRLENDYRVIAIDRPGSGHSVRNGLTPASPAEQATFIARLIDELGLERPLIVGHSLGGAIALALGLDHKDRISGLALIAPLTRHYQLVSKEFAGYNIPNPFMRWLISRTISTPNAIKNGKKTLAFVFGPQSPPADYATAGGTVAGLRPSHFFASSTDFMAIPATMAAQEKRYGELEMPVGLLSGDADRVVNFEHNGRWLGEQIAGLDLVTMEGVGHMPFYADADHVAAYVRRMADKAFAA